MLSRTRTALKFLTYGLLIGIFFAPRSGAETRQSIMQWMRISVRDLFGGTRA